jgi:hypothetical protein
VSDLEQVHIDDEDFPLRLDHTRPYVISAWGKKGEGKSYFNGLVYRSYPGDKLAIDVNGHAYVGDDAERIRLEESMPTRWPEKAPALGERRKPRNLHYIANPRSATYRDDLDRAVGLALFPKDHPVCLWAGEVGELTPHSKAGPHMRTLLMQNRHHRITALFDGPRPMNVDPLVLAQSDLVAVYRLPNPADRKRIADSVGIPPKTFDDVCAKTWREGKHWAVLYSSEHDQLFQLPPLPSDGDQSTEPAAA